MSAYREQVAAVLRVASIRGEARYAWLGRVDRSLPPAVLEWLNKAERRAQLINGLTDELYASFYTQGEPTPSKRAERAPMSGDRRLLNALTAANAGRGRWEGGWTVVGESVAGVVLQGQRLRVAALHRDFDSGSGLRVEKDLPQRSPGFYTALGDAGSDSDLRVYFNVSHVEAPRLMRAVTERLNGLAVPFMFKVADHPARFGRRDSAVLYLPGEALGDVPGIVARLRPGTPAFTLPLSAGMGAAEQRPDGVSFGLTRCRILAEGIVGAHESGARDRLGVVQRVFTEHGVDLDAPYREPTRAQHVL